MALPMLSHPMTLKFWPGKEIKTNKQAKNQYKAKHNSGRGKSNFHNITLSSSQRKSIDLYQSHSSVQTREIIFIRNSSKIIPRHRLIQTWPFYEE